MKKRILAIPATIAMLATIATAPAANAATGWFGRTEFDNVCFQDLESGCSGGTLKSDVEANCGCTGDFLEQDVQNGETYREYAYNNSYGTHKVTITYHETPNSYWRANTGAWCDDTRCIIG